MYLISSRAMLKGEEARQVSARRPNRARERSGLEGGVPASVLVVGAVVSVLLDAPLAEVSRHGWEVLGSGGVRGKEKGRVGRATTAGGVAGGEACRADLGSKGLNPERLFQVQAARPRLCWTNHRP